jgi:hypothetical protein
MYSAVVIYASVEKLEHASKQRLVQIQPNYPIKIFMRFYNPALTHGALF